MTPSSDSAVQCEILRNPTGEEVRQLVGLYRAQGWWLASDEGKESLLPRLIAGSHCFMVARRGAGIVGMGRAISDGISDAYIQDLTVCPECRNRGIGGMILRALLDRLHADGIAWIGLIAEPGSNNLYRRAGFREMAGSSPMLMIEEP